MVSRKAEGNRGGDPYEPADDLTPAEPGADHGAPAPAPAGGLRRWLPRRRSDDPVSFEQPAAAAPQELKPNDMVKPEPLYGYIVGLELIGVSILNLTATTGKGAPAHPPTVLSVIGLIAAIALLGIVRTNHRLIVAFSVVIAAFFVTLPKVPDRLQVPHLLALVIPVIYAFILAQRQRRLATARAKAGRAAANANTGNRKAQPSAGRRRSRRDKPVPAGPQASRRYTPPKPKRPRPEKASKPDKPNSAR